MTDFIRNGPVGNLLIAKVGAFLTSHSRNNQFDLFEKIDLSSILCYQNMAEENFADLTVEQSVDRTIRRAARKDAEMRQSMMKSLRASKARAQAAEAYAGLEMDFGDMTAKSNQIRRGFFVSEALGPNVENSVAAKVNLQRT